MSKVMVTGGSGFIGSHLVRRLSECNQDVVSIDINAPKVRVPGVNYHMVNILDFKPLSQLIDTVDTVYHLAAYPSVMKCQEEPNFTFDTNMMGTQKLLEIIRVRGKKQRFVFASSCAVYGDSKAWSLKETDRCAPTSLYGVQKRLAEVMLSTYSHHYNIPTIALRLFNVVGDGANIEGGIVARAAHRLPQRMQLELYGKGIHTRDYIYVGDVVDALMAAAVLDETLCDGSPINVGTGKATATLEVVKQVAKILKVKNFEAILDHYPTRPSEMKHCKANIKLAKELLGWAPKYKLKETLELACKAYDTI